MQAVAGATPVVSAFLEAEQLTMTEEAAAHLAGAGVEVHPYDAFLPALSSACADAGGVWLDPARTNARTHSTAMSGGARIVAKPITWLVIALCNPKQTATGYTAHRAGTLPLAAVTSVMNVSSRMIGPLMSIVNEYW